MSDTHTTMTGKELEDTLLHLRQTVIELSKRVDQLEEDDEKLPTKGRK